MTKLTPIGMLRVFPLWANDARASWGRGELILLFIALRGRFLYNYSFLLVNVQRYQSFLFHIHAFLWLQTPRQRVPRLVSSV